MVAGFDAHSVLQIFGAALIGGLIGLDRTAVGQVMVSQPVVAGPLTGWILGDPAAGLVVGGVLELIWVLDLPVGTFVPADSTVAAVAATAIAAIGGGGRSDLAVIGFSLFLTTIMVPFTMFADHLMRTRNAQIPDLAMGRDRRPTESRVTRWHLAGIIAFFLKSFTLCLAFIPAGIIVLSWFQRAPDPFPQAMVAFILFLPFLGVASMARKLSISSFDRSLLIGFAVGALCVQWLRLPVLAAVALAAAAGWVGERSRRA
jgi:mannose/fructose/N-acetylgalactosamine-specific phosphotransferase system component IIC